MPWRQSSPSAVFLLVRSPFLPPMEFHGRYLAFQLRPTTVEMAELYDEIWCNARWWLNHPVWNICLSNWIISPGLKIKKYNWNQQLEWHWLWSSTFHGTCFTDSFWKKTTTPKRLVSFSNLRCLVMILDSLKLKHWIVSSWKRSNESNVVLACLSCLEFEWFFAN